MKRSALTLVAVSALAFTHCAGAELPLPPHPDPYRPPPASSAAGAVTLTAAAATTTSAAPTPPPPSPSPSPSLSPSPSPPLAPPPPPTDPDALRCASVPPLGPDGAVPPAPPHPPLGQDIGIDGDRPAYVLPGLAGDPRVIIYLHGMCGDVTAADYFRESVRAHGTLIAVRGDTPCDNGRFKWRDEPSKIQARIRAAFRRVNELRGGELQLEPALLFGYSQGADRAEKVAAHYPQQYPRIVLGGAPMKASPQKLSRAKRVAFLGGELETTENMRAGYDALQAAGITARFFTLECAYHGYFGIHPESQLTEVLDWVTAP